MKLNIPSEYKLVFDEKLEDVNGQGAYLIHIKTGAKVALIRNDDTNKVFYIGFRTPPKNSTGVAHIIEHSVLCGSKNFPVKDPFIELAKGSLNTFLNAMTYSDRTVYPVASKNDQDFKNLMHVYLDAVLFPNIYDRKEIFQQEGWHYSLDDIEGELKINGVVYNEMKGAFSSPEQQLFRLNLNSLFPDTPYGNESGGDPRFIPDLSYDEFLEFHKTFYHPSNSYIYLYGDMDFEERLSWLDSEYLSKFDYLEVDSEIPMQDGFSKLKEVEEFYPLGEDENPKENTYLSLNYAINEARSKNQSIAFDIIMYVLFGAPGAPIKQALINAGIGKDILSRFSNDYLQPVMSIVAKSSDEEQKEEFLSIINNMLAEISEEGLNEKSLLGAINILEFHYREADFGSYPKGLIYGLRVLSCWLYDEEKLFDYLKDSIIYEELKKKINTGYFEQLIKEHLLNNTHATLVILKPKEGLNKIQEAETKKKLSLYKESLSEEEIRTIVEETKVLRDFQEATSTKEELETIPLLTREDIDPDPEPLYNIEKIESGIPVIHHEMFTNEIAYLRLEFDVKDIPKELLPYLSLLSYVLGYMDTENYGFMEFANEINIHTGDVSANVVSFSVKDTTQDYLPMFEINTKVMYNKIPEAFRLIEEMIFRTKLTDYKRLKEIIEEIKSRMQMRFQSSGHSVAVNRAMSYYSAHGMFKEATQGITFYQFIENISSNYGEMKDTIISKFKELVEMIFVKDNLMVSVTANETGFGKFRQSFDAFVNNLPGKASQRLFKEYRNEPLSPKCLNEGFKATMQVQYVARAGNFFETGYDYTGALRVLRMILSYDYLWNNLRVKGGAYGCMCGFSGVDGDVYFTSYRDPNLAETNQVYENIPEFVKNYSADERGITKSIIGTISTLDMPLSPKAKGARSLSFYLAGIEYEDLKKERDEIINITEDKIRALSDLVKSVLNEGNICVIGNESKIEKNREIFNEVKNLIK